MNLSDFYFSKFFSNNIHREFSLYVVTLKYSNIIFFKFKNYYKTELNRSESTVRPHLELVSSHRTDQTHRPPSAAATWNPDAPRTWQFSHSDHSPEPTNRWPALALCHESDNSTQSWRSPSETRCNHSSPPNPPLPGSLLPRPSVRSRPRPGVLKIHIILKKKVSSRVHSTVFSRNQEPFGGVQWCSPYEVCMSKNSIELARRRKMIKPAAKFDILFSLCLKFFIWINKNLIN